MASASRATAAGKGGKNVSPLSAVGEGVDSTFEHPDDGKHGEGSDGLGELGIASRRGEGAGGTASGDRPPVSSPATTLGSNYSTIHTMRGMSVIGGDEGDGRTDSREAEDRDLSVVIFKTAFNFTKEFLWKEQVGDVGVRRRPKPQVRGIVRS